jgi:hypothetical protein
MKRIAPLIGLILLGGCQTEEQLIRQREEGDNFICLKRGGDYDKCWTALVEGRRVCLKQWYALPPEERTKLSLQKFETRPPEIRACNAIGV